jgi:hypothetical protein
MDEKHARWITPFALLLLNLIGWVAFYFLVSGAPGRQAEAAPGPERDALARSVDARLATLEAQLQQIAARLDAAATQARDDVGRRASQAELKRLEGELDDLSRRPHVTVDLNTLLQGLRPNVSFGLLRIAPTKPGVLELTFQTRNLGSHGARVEQPEFLLASKPLAASGRGDGLLVPDQDYTVKAHQVEALLPNESRNLAYTIVLNDPRRLDGPLHYKVTFRTRTDPAVVATSAGLLNGKLPEKDIRALSVSEYDYVGEVAAESRRSTP